LDLQNPVQHGLQKLLNSHPQIHCSGESLINRLYKHIEIASTSFNNEIDDINNIRLQSKSNYIKITKENLDIFFKDLVYKSQIDLINSDKKNLVKYLGDKGPEYLHNFMFFKRLYPNAKYLHIIRDGRDALVSGWNQNIRLYGENYYENFKNFDNYFKHYASEWSSEIKKGRTFSSINEGSYFELKYEDLLSNSKHILTDLLNFLGLDSSSRLVNDCIEKNSFNVLSKGRKKGEEDKSSFFRKGIKGEWRNYFDSDLNEFCKNEIGDILEKLGYE